MIEEVRKAILKECVTYGELSGPAVKSLSKIATLVSLLPEGTLTEQVSLLEGLQNLTSYLTHGRLSIILLQAMMLTEDEIKEIRENDELRKKWMG